MTAIHAAGATGDDDVDDDLSAVLRAPLPDLTADDCPPSQGLVLASFLRPHLHGLHPYLIERDLGTGVDALSLLPETGELLRWHRRGDAIEVLARVGDALLVVRSWRRSAEVWASGPDRTHLESLVRRVLAKVHKPPVEDRIRMTFWQASRRSYARSRNIDVPSWAEVAALYPRPVRAALDELVAFRPAPGTIGGRLLLWHGAPGTGKTTAVRALFDAWRQWTSAHVVSDPEVLLNDADYLARVLLDTDDDEDDEDVDHRWRLVVAEDTEELLRRDLRHRVGPALGRLLNAADGLLGQGMKALILLTTNEPIVEMHPALLRPGRCLARIEFTAFDPAEASGLLGEQVTQSMTLAELMERKGELSRLEAVATATAPGQYL